jgi:hypothetical protein
LFVNANQLDQNAHKYVDGVTDLHPYEAFLPTLREVAGGLQLDKENVGPFPRFNHIVFLTYMFSQSGWEIEHLGQ